MKPNDRRYEYDPVFLHARREAIIVLIVWALCLVWTVAYCYTFGYRVDTDSIPITLGMPSWIVWGVLMPWCAVTVFTFCFGLYLMADDDLGENSQRADREDAVND